MIYLNANRSAAYRWDGRAHQFEFFFFGGAGRWVKSDLLTGLFRKEAGSPTPEDWLERYAEDEGWQSVSDADFVRLRKAAEAACAGQEEETPCEPKTAPSGAAAANPGASAAPSSCSTDAAPSTSGSSTVLTQASASAPACPAACGTAAPLAPAQAAPAFDYGGLDRPTADALRWAEREICAARRDYVARLAQAVDLAHDALCGEVVHNVDNSKHGHRGEDTFRLWRESVGLGKTTAYKLLQVAALLKGSTPEEQAVLEAASPSLLYAAAKPSAPAELVQAVKEGDITTHKQYQELLAQLRAREDELARVQREAELDRKEQEDANAAAMRYKAEAERRASDQQRLEGRVKSLTDALDAAREDARTSAARVQELEARPIEVRGADSADIARWRAEGAEAARAELDKARREAAALQDRLAELEAGPSGGDAVALARQAAAGVETILQGQFALLDALPYDTYEAAAAPFEALRDRLTAALELGRWPDEGEKEL